MPVEAGPTFGLTLLAELCITRFFFCLSSEWSLHLYLSEERSTRAAYNAARVGRGSTPAHPRANSCTQTIVVCPA